MMCWNQRIIKCKAQRYLRLYPDQHGHLHVREWSHAMDHTSGSQSVVSAASALLLMNTIEMHIVGPVP